MNHYTERRAQDASRDAALMAHREEIEARAQVRTISIPIGHVRVRPLGTCPFCTGSVWDVRMPTVDRERPHVSEAGEIVCMLCARRVATLVIGGSA